MPCIITVLVRLPMSLFRLLFFQRTPDIPSFCSICASYVYTKSVIIRCNARTVIIAEYTITAFLRHWHVNLNHSHFSFPHQSARGGSRTRRRWHDPSVPGRSARTSFFRFSPGPPAPPRQAAHGGVLFFLSCLKVILSDTRNRVFLYYPFNFFLFLYSWYHLVSIVYKY